MIVNLGLRRDGSRVGFRLDLEVLPRPHDVVMLLDHSGEPIGRGRVTEVRHVLVISHDAANSSAEQMIEVDAE